MSDLDAMLAARQAILDEIVAEIAPAEIEPDEFTRDDLMQRSGVSRGTAGEHLRRLVAAGRLTWRYVTIGGKSCKAYREFVHK